MTTGWTTASESNNIAEGGEAINSSLHLSASDSPRAIAKRILASGKPRSAQRPLVAPSNGVTELGKLLFYCCEQKLSASSCASLA
jgi:hypothetical protein